MTNADVLAKMQHDEMAGAAAALSEAAARLGRLELSLELREQQINALKAEVLRLRAALAEAAAAPVTDPPEPPPPESGS